MKPERIIRHAGLALIIFSLFMVLWPFVKKAYCSYFIEVSTHFFNKQSDDLTFLIKSRQDKASDYDMEVRFISKKKFILGSNQPLSGRFEMDSWAMGYFPFALLISLAISTPLSYSRRLRALVRGCLFVILFILLKMKLILHDVYRIESAATGLFSGFIKGAYEAIIINFGSNILILVIIWILVTFKSKDFESLVSPEKSELHS